MPYIKRRRNTMNRKRTPQQRDEDWLWSAFNSTPSSEDVEVVEDQVNCNYCVYTGGEPFIAVGIDFHPCNFYDDCVNNDYRYYSPFKPYGHDPEWDDC